MGCPDGWTILNEELWHLPPREAKAFWWALCRARYTRPCALRQQLSLVGQVRLSEESLGRLCHPAVVLTMLEDLIHEGLLRRAQGLRLTEVFLHNVQANGRWSGDPEPPEPCARWHAPDIVTLADTGRP